MAKRFFDKVKVQSDKDSRCLYAKCSETYVNELSLNGYAKPQRCAKMLALADDLFVFSFNDHSLADPAFEAQVKDYIGTSRAELMFKEYGDHLPGAGLKSNVYVLKKA